MDNTFSHNLSELRRERGFSQRKVAADLNISQALLSHYENGAREPGLQFVCRACDYYGVSADRILGRVREERGPGITATQFRNMANQLRELADIAESYIK